ncbi:MAG: RtcB family protein [bacterium]|nr:RtcB family protein [bacterium]
MTTKTYREISTDHVPIKAWIDGVYAEDNAIKQLRNTAQMPFIFRWVAAMPDVHVGIGATVGSVIPTKGAIIPAAVGVDIGCGMIAQRTSMRADQLPDDLLGVRVAIEAAVPHGWTDRGGRNDKGSWQDVPDGVRAAWAELDRGYRNIVDKHRAIDRGKTMGHLGTLGSGNHFIEICLDENDEVWVMLHSGSRGVGNRIGRYFIERAQKDMRTHIRNLPDKDLAYFEEGAEHFDDYVAAVDWAQEFARINREIMMQNVLAALAARPDLPDFTVDRQTAVNCHHNYVQKETHYDTEVFVTRKGAVSAQRGQLGIIPGSMGARSYIVRGRGNSESFCSCSHGAGRVHSRSKAKKLFTLDDHIKATEGVECRKDEGVIDEIPMAYKDIDRVMAAQADLVEVVHTLRQVVCVKG